MTNTAKADSQIRMRLATTTLADVRVTADRYPSAFPVDADLHLVVNHADLVSRASRDAFATYCYRTSMTPDPFFIPVQGCPIPHRYSADCVVDHPEV